jgi:hypothetical protein
LIGLHLFVRILINAAEKTPVDIAKDSFLIDINKIEAFITLQDGTTVDIGLCHLPKNIKIGENINVELNCSKMANDRMENFF